MSRGPAPPQRQVYKLLSAYTPHELAKDVNAHLETGWTLYGSPCVAERIAMQAVIKFYDLQTP